MLAVAVVLSTVLSVPATDRLTTPDTVLRIAAVRSDAASRQPLPFLDDAAVVYEQLLSKSTPERRRLFRQMPSSLKSGVWAHHLLTMLVRHPEFTAEQRAVIQDALSLLTPDWFEIGPASPQWDALVDQPLRRLQQRAMAVFGGRVARELFTDLGPDPVQRNAEGQSASAAKSISGSAPLSFLRPVPHTDPAPDCECNVVSDWCPNFYSGFVCKNFWCVFATYGCGTLFRYACEGMCRPT